MIISSLLHLARFCTSKVPVIPYHLGDNVAFAHDLPKHLNEETILKVLDPTRKDITKIQLILNKLGLPTGKAAIHFTDKHVMMNYSRKYDGDFITVDKAVHKIKLKPIVDKT